MRENSFLFFFFLSPATPRSCQVHYVYWGHLDFRPGELPARIEREREEREQVVVLFSPHCQDDSQHVIQTWVIQSDEELTVSTILFQFAPIPSVHFRKWWQSTASRTNLDFSWVPASHLTMPSVIDYHGSSYFISFHSISSLMTDQKIKK